jgi:hypothetical protein
VRWVRYTNAFLTFSTLFKTSVTNFYNMQTHFHLFLSTEIQCTPITLLINHRMTTPAKCPNRMRQKSCSWSSLCMGSSKENSFWNAVSSIVSACFLLTAYWVPSHLCENSFIVIHHGSMA